MKNVLHVIDSLGLGGAQKLVKDIIEAESDDNIFVYALRRKRPELNVDHAHVTIYESKSRFSVLSLWRLKELVEINEIGILHCHLFKSQVFGWLSKIFWFSNIRLIFHEHGQILQDQKWYYWVLSQLQYKVDRFIAVSNGVRRALINYSNIDEASIGVVYNFINFENLPIDDDKHLGNSQDQPVFRIGFAGRLSREKGCDTLIRAIKKLDFPYRLLIAGDGAELDSLRQLTESMDLKDHIEFLGFVKDISTFYARIDALIIPSLSESFSLSALEAQYFRVPVIGSRIDGLSEIVHDKKNGLLFEPRNVDDLAEKITLIYTDGALSRGLIEDGVLNARKYSYQHYSKQVREMYASLSRS